jgi:hypothetical protein
MCYISYRNLSQHRIHVVLLLLRFSHSSDLYFSFSFLLSQPLCLMGCINHPSATPHHAGLSSPHFSSHLSPSPHSPQQFLHTKWSKDFGRMLYAIFDEDQSETVNFEEFLIASYLSCRYVRTFERT